MSEDKGYSGNALDCLKKNKCTDIAIKNYDEDNWMRTMNNVLTSD